MPVGAGTDRPRLRGLLHAGAGVLAPIAVAALLLRASGGAERAAVAVYGVTMTAMLLASASYHRGAWSAAARRRMKALDHTTIFAFIVGSYVPLTVITLGRGAGAAFLGSLIAVALVGSVVKLRRLEGAGGPADALYGVATWWGLLIAVPIVRSLGAPEVALLVGALLLYSLSAGFLTRRWLDPAPSTFGYHEIAHSLVVLAVACHYALYWRALG